MSLDALAWKVHTQIRLYDAQMILESALAQWHAVSAVPTCCCHEQQYYVIDRLQLEALAAEQPRAALGDSEWPALPCLDQQEPVARIRESLQSTALLGLTDASGQLAKPA